MEETQLLLPGDVTWGREAVTVRPLQAGSISFHIPDIFMQHRLSWLNADLSPGFLLRRFKSAQLRFFTLSKDVCSSPQPFGLAIWRLPSPAVSLPCCGGNEPSWTSHVPCLTSGKISCWGVWESLIFAALKRGRSQLSQLEPSYKTLLWKHSRFFIALYPSVSTRWKLSEKQKPSLSIPLSPHWATPHRARTGWHTTSDEVIHSLYVTKLNFQERSLRSKKRTRDTDSGGSEPRRCSSNASGERGSADAVLEPPASASGQPGWLRPSGQPPRELQKRQRGAKKQGPTVSIPRNRFALGFCTRSPVRARKGTCAVEADRENKDEKFGFSEGFLIAELKLYRIREERYHSRLLQGSMV